jgi:branched-chain amino acid transport system ATP-binding protein
MSLLEIQDLKVRRGGVPALRGVTLEVDRREVVALLGANGAGKTTTLRAISDLSKPESGEIRFNGHSVVGVGSARVVEAGIAHVPEGSRVWPEMTVLENLRLGAYAVRRKGSAAERLESIFELLPRLAERAGQAAGTLSGGERQMAAIGRALMASPTLLLMDEPSLGLSPRVVDTVFDTIQAIRKDGVAVLLVEQNVVRALEIAERGYVLEGGKIVREGSGEELLDDPEVRQAYLGRTAGTGSP